MPRSLITMTAPRPRSERLRLLAASALGGGVLLLAASAQAQTLPGIPLPANVMVSTGGTAPVITAPTANSLDVDLQAPRTVINWDSFHVSGADSVTFHFGQTSDIVLNKSPTTVMVDAGGQVAGKVGAVTGGNIWFYSPGGVVISPGAVMTAGSFLFARGDGLVDLDFVDATSPLTVLRSAADSLIQIDTLSVATSASISPTGDLVLTAATGDLNATTALAAGSATVTATTGSVAVGEVTATAGAASVGAPAGSITLGALNGGAGATATALTDVSATSASTSGASGDIVLTGGASASLGGGVSGRDIMVLGPSASLGSGSATGDVFVTATTGGATLTGAVTAGDDIEVTATSGSVAALGASLTSTGAGAADDAHVLARSTGGAVALGAAATQGSGAAAGDITIDGATTASLGSGASSRDLKVLGPTASLGSGGAAGDVFVTATTGGASVTGAVTAGDDIEVTATSGSVTASGASLTSTGVGAADEAHVLASSSGGSVTLGSAATQGTGAAAGDITIDGATSASLGSGTSSRDLKVLGPTASLGSGGAAGDVFVTATTGGASVTGAVTAGDDIEVTATSGAVTASGASLTSTGVGAADEAHVLARSNGGSVTVGSAATQGTGGAAGDVTVDAATTASLASGASSRDLKVLGPTASLGDGGAAGDVFVTATTGGASITGAVTAGDDIEVTATSGSVTALSASLTSTGVGGADDAHVLARSTGGSVTVGAAATQGSGARAGDITLDGATTAALTSGASSRDLKVLAPGASLGSGAAAGDVFVTATTGNASVTGTVTAGDDIEITATSGSVTATGASLTSTGVGGADDAHVLAQSTGGSVTVGSAATQGTGARAGDITLDGATTASLDTASSSRDVKVLGPTASLGSGGAVGDVFVTATTGGASVTGAVSAGDDIEVTATTGAVTAAGAALTSTGVGAADDAHVLLRSTGGSVALGSATAQGAGAAAGDVTLDGATTASLSGTARATRDVQLLAGDSILADGSLAVAGRDLVASAGSGAVALGTARADDDIAIRALNGAITASGDLQAGQTHDPADPDTAGAADTLLGATLAGHDLDLKAQTIAVTGDVAAGRAPDPAETLGAAQLGSDVIVAATSADASPAAPALRLATGANKTVTAHQDISLRAENAGASSIQAGDLSAGRDVAVYSAAGNITLGAALAGDDVVLRAPGGAIVATGDVAAGRDFPGMTPADVPGAADDLNTALPFGDFDGNPATVFSVVGFDVNIVSQAVQIGGTTIAGRQPSTDDPDTAGPIDTTTSDVRIETRLSATPVANLAPNIVLGGVIATRDMQIDSYKAVTAGDLVAGRDIAVLGRGGVTPGAAPGDHSGSGVTLGSAHAGDDALAFSIYGRTHVLGSVASGAPLLRLVPTNNRVIDGATEAADQLAIYLHYFDLDDASAPYVLKGGVIHLYGEGVTVGAGLAAQGLNGDVQIRSSLDIDVSGVTTAGGLAMFQTQTATAGRVKVGAVTAAGDVILDGAGGSGPVGALATGKLTSTGGDVAVRARDGAAISLAGVAAGDDVVVRTAGAVSISGVVTAGGAADSAGAGDALRLSDGAVTLEGQTYDLTGHDVDVVGGSVTTTATMTASGAQSDVRVQSAGAISLGALSAGRDVLVDGSSSVSTGVLTAGRDVGARSTGAGAALNVGGASAGDDVVLRGNGAIVVSGALSSGSGADSAETDQAGDLMFGVAKSNLGGDLDLLGRTIDVRSSAGSIQVAGAVNAATDARFQTQAGAGGSVSVGAVTAGRDVLLDGGAGAGANGVVASGTVTATGGDVAVRARDGQAIQLAGISAGDDVVLRAMGAVTVGGPVSAGGGADGLGLGDVLLAGEGAVILEGQSFDLTGHDVDIVGASVTSTGLMSASGSQSDVRVQSAGAVSLGDLTAGRDVLVDGASSVSTGVLTAGRDVGARSTGAGASLTVGGASAGDDVVLRADGAVLVTGAMTSGTGADSAATDQAGDLMFGAARSNLGGDLDLTGRTIDVRSSAGSIQVNGAVDAATDARFQTQALTGGSVAVGAVTAGRDILLDGGAGSGANAVLAAGTLIATGGDVAVRARDGKAIQLAGISAGDDVVLRATAGVTLGGPVSAGGGLDAAGLGDLLGVAEGAITLEGQTFDLTGNDMDIVGGAVTATGPVSASGAQSDVRVQSAGAISLGALTAGRDVLVDGASTVSTGVLTAGRDVGARSTGANSTLTVGGASAGDDVVLRANGAILVTGALASGGGADSAATDQAGDLMFGVAKSNLGGDLDLVGRTTDVRSSAGSIQVTGAVNAASDARFQTQATTGGSVKVAAVTAGRDILLDGGGAGPNGAQASGLLSATNGDVAVRARDGSAIQLAGVLAGDDVVLRAIGAIRTTGAVTAGGGADDAGAGDALRLSDGAVTLEGQSFDLTGHDIDILGGTVTTTGALTALGGQADIRLQSSGAIALGALTAGRDVLVDGGSTVAAGMLVAGRDIGVRSTGTGSTVTLGAASAGDDLVIRAKGAIQVTGSLISGGGADSADADQAGDLMFGAEGSTLAGALDLTGQSIDVRSSAGAIQVTGPVTAATDARFQTQAGTGGAVKVGAVTAGRDILLDGGGAATAVEATGNLLALNGDVAVRARAGKAISLAGVSAGDDVVLRATGDIQASGAVVTTGRPSSNGLGDRLADASEGGALSVGGLTFGLSGSDIDVVGNVVGMLRTSAMGSVRIKAGGATVQNGGNAGVDILIDSSTSLTVGDLSASGDIALRSRAGSLTVGRLVAGDDIVLRAALGITATSLTALGTERLGVGDQLFAADPTGLGGDFDLLGNTIDVKSAGGPISVGTADSAGDVRVQSAGGDISLLGAVNAGRDILADGAAVTAAGALTAGGDVALYGRTGAVSVNSILAGDDIVIRADGDITATGDLKSGQGSAASGAGDKLIVASAAAPLFGDATDADGGVIDLSGAGIKLSGGVAAEGSNGHLRVRSTGATTLGAATATGDIAIDAAGDLSAGALKAGRDLALRASAGAITLGSATAGDDIVLRASRSITVLGPLTTGGAGDGVGAGDGLFKLSRTALGGDLDLGGQTIDIASATGAVSTTGAMTAGGDIRLRASGAVASAGALKAGRDLLLDGGSVEAGSVVAGGDVAIRAASGALRLGAVSAGDDVVLRASGDISVTGAMTAGGGADTQGLGDRLFALDPLGLGGDFDLAGQSIDVKSKAGAITVQGQLAASQDVRLQASGDVVVSGGVDAGRDVLLDGGSVAAGDLRAGRDLAVRAQAGAISLGALAAGDDLVLRATGDATVRGPVTVGGGADRAGAGDRLFATDRTRLAGDLDLTGATLDVRAHGAIALGGAARAGGDARFQTVGEGAITLAGVTAGGDVLADGAAVQAGGSLVAGRDVAVRGRTGGVSLAGVSAGDDIAIRAAGAVKATGALSSGTGTSAEGAADRLVSAEESGMIMRLVDPLAAKPVIEGFALKGGDIDIRSGEAITLAGEAVAAGASSVRLQAAGKVSASALNAGDGLFVRAGDVAPGGAWRAKTARLEITAKGGLTLGEGVTALAGGAAISSAALGQIDAPTVQIFVGDSSGSLRGAALSIGTLAIDVAKIRTSLELYAGGLADVVISGAFAPSTGVANATNVRIGAPNADSGDWTPRAIKVGANTGGSIGAATSTTGRTFTDVRAFGSVELNALGDILIGYQDFLDKLSATPATSVAQAVKTLIAPQSTGGPRILITAGTLTLRANGKVAQQDTAGLLGSIPTGLYLLGGTAGAPQLVLGRTSDKVSAGGRLPDFIELNGALTSGGSIMTGQSVSLANAIAFDRGVTPSGYYRLNSCGILQPGSCMPSTAHSNISIAPDQLTGLTLEDHTAAAGTADPTVASATNEEVWKDPR